MSNKILAVVLLIACVVIGAMSLQLVSERAEGQEFRRGSSRTRRTRATTPTAQAVDNEAGDTAGDQSPVQSAMKDDDGDDQGAMLMEIVDPVQRYQSHLIELASTDTLVLMITDTQSGVVRLREIRRQTTWQEFSFSDYGFRR